nr:hypothetical protein CFP56_79495 [Quercus suber]POF18332.1 hypothetical protein CFP56_75823 [Quercus suber]
MYITNILKESFLPFITKLLQLFSKSNPQPSSSGDAVDPELPDLAAGDDGVDPVEVPAEAAGLPLHKAQVLGHSPKAQEFGRILLRNSVFHGHYHSISSLPQIRYRGHLYNFRLRYYYLPLFVALWSQSVVKL